MLGAQFENAAVDKEKSDLRHPMGLRIVIADDKKIFRDELRQQLESRPGWRVVAEAENGREAVEKTGQSRPDVLVIDYSMPELDGISAIPEIRNAAPKTEIVLLTVHDAQATVRRAIEAGARGYVVKSQIVRDLVAAVEAASEHKTFFSSLDSGPDATHMHGSNNK
jgi:DNA-binding NarL/FixJ family response regulator